MPYMAAINTAVGSCISCKLVDMALKKSAVAGAKSFINSEAFDHFVASAVCTICLGVSSYGVAVSAPLVYKHSRAFVASIKPGLVEPMNAAD